MDNRENPQAITNGTSGLRRLGIIVGGIGLGAVLAYLFSKARGGRPAGSLRRNFPDQPVDDRGTRQDEAAQILRNLRDRAFEANDERLALALGRPTEEIVAWNAGEEVIDDDVVMKARGIAMHRGVRIE
ncbi:MAG: hypothetical protein H0V18_10530 [Pyrinomonadaceae bacterium]|nr:hypothetical protein [Pyrinomonadaceae bacterium]